MKHFFGGLPAAQLGGIDAAAGAGKRGLLEIQRLAQAQKPQAGMLGQNGAVIGRGLLDIGGDIIKRRKRGKRGQKRVQLLAGDDRTHDNFSVDGCVNRAAAIVRRQAVVLARFVENGQAGMTDLIDAADALAAIDDVLTHFIHWHFPPFFCSLRVAQAVFFIITENF